MKTIVLNDSPKCRSADGRMGETMGPMGLMGPMGPMGGGCPKSGGCPVCSASAGCPKWFCCSGVRVGRQYLRAPRIPRTLRLRKPLCRTTVQSVGVGKPADAGVKSGKREKWKVGNRNATDYENHYAQRHSRVSELLEKLKIIVLNDTPKCRSAPAASGFCSAGAWKAHGKGLSKMCGVVVRNVCRPDPADSIVRRLWIAKSSGQGILLVTVFLIFFHLKERLPCIR